MGSLPAGVRRIVVVVLVGAAACTGPGGGAPAPATSPSAAAQATTPATCTPTPQDVPANYAPDAPVRSKIGAGGYVFEGVVRSAAGCAGIPAARVELWLAGPSGGYDADHRATVVADGNGRYRVDSAFPAAYGGGRAHIHIRATAQGHRPLVSIHFPAAGASGATMDLVLERS